MIYKKVLKIVKTNCIMIIVILKDVVTRRISGVYVMF